MQSINDVFSELDSRIDNLKSLSTSGLARNHLSYEYDVSIIQRNLYKFPNEAGPRIEISIKELKDLKSLGISLINKYQLSGEFDSFEDNSVFTPKTIELDDKTRKRYYKLAKDEIDYYLKELNLIKLSLVSQKSNNHNSPIAITLSPDFSFPQLRLEYPDAEPVLNKSQLALLFQYLKNEKLILPYEKSSLSSLVMHLTGYSENTIRKDLTYLDDLKKPTKRQNNLSILKDYLQKVITAIDTDIKSQKKL